MALSICITKLANILNIIKTHNTCRIYVHNDYIPLHLSVQDLYEFSLTKCVNDMVRQATWNDAHDWFSATADYTHCHPLTRNCI